MKYFTRELYQRMQPILGLTEEEEDKYVDEGERLWESADCNYSEHLDQIKGQLEKVHLIF